MKKLSIEEKAKRYDEAIKKARNIVNSINVGLIGKNSFEAVFPELKELEDEKIRKALRERIIRYDPNNEILIKEEGISQRQFIDWLENQNKKAEPIAGFASEFEKQVSHLIASAINREHEYNKGYVKWAAQSLIEYAKREIEKQGEQKPIKEHDVCDFCEGRYVCVNPCPTKLIDEQKSADKVEPKFEIGDIITNGEIIGKVDENENNKYHGWFGYNKDLSVHYADIPDVENWHLWTIQDAKDGDVLCGYPGADYPWIGIFYKLNAEGAFSSYCYLQAGLQGKFCPPSGENIFGKRNVDEHSSKDVVPATKEQRDLLFQKMKEAGYEWDAESKQLISLKAEPNGEQKPANNVEPKFREGDSIQFKGFRHNRYTIKEVCGLSHYVNTMGNSMDMSYTDANFEVIKDSDKVEISPAWSEEDENRINRLIAYFEDKESFTAEDDIVYANWLKSLKDRVQPKQEWSEKDGDILRWTINNLIELKDRFGEEYGKVGDCINWLKSLRPQSQWKPSGKQLEALKEACDEHWEPDGLDPLYTLWEQLKKLKE